MTAPCMKLKLIAMYLVETQINILVSFYKEVKENKFVLSVVMRKNHKVPVEEEDAEKKESKDTLSRGTWSNSCFPVVVELKENSSSASMEVTRTLTCKSENDIKKKMKMFLT